MLHLSRPPDALATMNPLHPAAIPPADREQTLGEEIANALSHGLGVVLAIAALPILVARAVGHGGVADVVAAAVFAATMILLYGVSTLYHALPAGRANASTPAIVFVIACMSCP